MIVKLPDDTVAAFENKPAILMIPMSREEYIAFLDRATALHDGIAMMSIVLGKMHKTAGLEGEAHEGLVILANLTQELGNAEAAMQTFFAPAIAISNRDGKGARLQ